jgi:hypothetical protein
MPANHEDAPRGDDEIDIDAVLQDLARSDWQERAPQLMPVIVETLERQGVRFETEPGRSRVKLRINGEEITYDCLIMADEGLSLVRCYVRPPVWVPEPARTAMCEAVTRANYALPFGNFEMDMDDGELCFKAGVDVEGGTLTPQMVDSLVGVGVAMCNLFYPAFMRVVYGGVPPERAIREVGE